MTSLLGQPKDYFDLVKSIGEAKSKQEEDRIVAEEVNACSIDVESLFGTILIISLFGSSLYPGGVSQESNKSNWCE